ncbi:MAG: hypothetical protein HOH43_06720, partial [Candidatus Latescibacteria bacterium]|nr:hypothetical protein [Candidatus Latescibacterota bacterium]
MSPLSADVSPFRDRLLRAANAYQRRSIKIPDDRSLEQIVPGIEVETASGRFYLVEPEPELLHSEISGIAGKHVELRSWTRESQDPLPEEYRALIGPEPERILYLDIETTGFTGTPLFLIGLMYLQAGRIRVTQLLAR